MVKRIDRVNELIKRELSKVLEEQFNFEETLITVSYINTSPDLRTAKAYVSIFPHEKSEEAIEKLKKEFSKFQQILSQTIKLKYIPKIEVNLDESFEYEDKIEGLIKKIKDDNISS